MFKWDYQCGAFEGQILANTKGEARALIFKKHGIKPVRGHAVTVNILKKEKVDGPIQGRDGNSVKVAKVPKKQATQRVSQGSSSRIGECIDFKMANLGSRAAAQGA